MFALFVFAEGMRQHAPVMLLSVFCWVDGGVAVLCMSCSERQDPAKLLGCVCHATIERPWVSTCVCKLLGSNARFFDETKTNTDHTDAETYRSYVFRIIIVQMYCKIKAARKQGRLFKAAPRK